MILFKYQKSEVKSFITYTAKQKKIIFATVQITLCENQTIKQKIS